jgi:hypothetical protein
MAVEQIIETPAKLGDRGGIGRIRRARHARRRAENSADNQQEKP